MSLILGQEECLTELQKLTQVGTCLCASYQACLAVGLKHLALLAGAAQPRRPLHPPHPHQADGSWRGADGGGVAAGIVPGRSGVRATG